MNDENQLEYSDITALLGPEPDNIRETIEKKNSLRLVEGFIREKILNDTPVINNCNNPHKLTREYEVCCVPYDLDVKTLYQKGSYTRLNKQTILSEVKHNYRFTVYRYTGWLGQYTPWRISKTTIWDRLNNMITCILFCYKGLISIREENDLLHNMIEWPHELIHCIL